MQVWAVNWKRSQYKTRITEMKRGNSLFTVSRTKDSSIKVRREQEEEAKQQHQKNDEMNKLNFTDG